MNDAFKIFDAHVHMGYYLRVGCDSPYYYSPRRICGVLKRCAIDDFIVSSTCAQIEGVKISDITSEAHEVKRIAGARAHVFFWLSKRLYEEDVSLGWMTSGVFSGLKLHESETPWMEKHFDDLLNALNRANECGWPVQMHAGPTGLVHPKRLKSLAKMFPHIRFDFAHCRPMDEMAEVIAECPNVWTDTAYMAIEDFSRLNDYDWHGRLMFGTDLPVWQAMDNCSLTERYRRYKAAFASTSIDGASAFSHYLGRECKTA